MSEMTDDLYCCACDEPIGEGVRLEFLDGDAMCDRCYVTSDPGCRRPRLVAVNPEPRLQDGGEQ